MRSDYVSRPVTDADTTAAVVSRSLRPRWWLIVVLVAAAFLSRDHVNPWAWRGAVAYSALLGVAMAYRVLGGYVWSHLPGRCEIIEIWLRLRQPRFLWWLPTQLWNTATWWICGLNQHGHRKPYHVYDLLNSNGKLVWVGITGALRSRLSGHIESGRVTGVAAMRRVTTCRGQFAAERWEKGRIMAARAIIGGRVVNKEETAPSNAQELICLILWWVPFHLAFGVIFPAAKLTGRDRKAIRQVAAKAAGR